MRYFSFTAQRGMEMRYIERLTMRETKHQRYLMENDGWNCTSINGEKT